MPFSIEDKNESDDTFDPELHGGNTLIMDGMATLQAMKGKLTTFGELCDLIFSILQKAAHYWKAKRIDFVTDRYPDISIKNPERNRRAACSGVQKTHVHSKDQRVPKQWKKFLSVKKK